MPRSRVKENTSIRRSSAVRTPRNGHYIERRIDRQEPATSRARGGQAFWRSHALHRQDLEEVSKKIGRSKDASLKFLDERLGLLRLGELDRERLIKFGKERAQEGASPVTVGIDLGYIKTILSHAAAVHGVTVSIEPINLARIALGRLGLVPQGQRARPSSNTKGSSISSSRVSKLMIGNKSPLTGSFDLPSQRQCGRTKLRASRGVTLIPKARCPRHIGDPRCEVPFVLAQDRAQMTRRRRHIAADLEPAGFTAAGGRGMAGGRGIDQDHIELVQDRRIDLRTASLAAVGRMPWRWRSNSFAPSSVLEPSDGRGRKPRATYRPCESCPGWAATRVSVKGGQARCS